MALPRLATRSRKPLAAAAAVAPLLLMCLLIATASSSSAAAAAAASTSGDQYEPSYGDTYSTCFPVEYCDEAWCGARCSELGHGAAGSACWSGKDATLRCCCGLGRTAPSPSDS